MDKNEYLARVLQSQTLSEGSDELTTLRERRKAVEKALRDEFGSTPTIRYGGSRAKGAMVKEAYDLDLICYFPHESTVAGETLEEIYNTVRDTLAKKYLVESRGSALRLKGKGEEDFGVDFHIDVVPGRYVDDSNSDTFLYQATGEKKRLKTNLEVHIKHVKDSGVRDAIRLVKLWKVRRAIAVKTFALELVTVKLLKDKKTATLADQLEHVWTTLRDTDDPASIEDPANPNGNDLSAMFEGGIWSILSGAAIDTLRRIDDEGWESVYGSVEETDKEAKAAGFREAAAVVTPRTRPWRSEE